MLRKRQKTKVWAQIYDNDFPCFLITKILNGSLYTQVGKHYWLENKTPVIAEMQTRINS